MLPAAGGREPTYAPGVRGRATWRQNLFVVASALLAAAVVLPVTAFGESGRKDVTYVPLDRAAFVQQSVVDGWINKPVRARPGVDLRGTAGTCGDTSTSRAVKTLHGTPLPIWETWYSGEEVYLDNQEVDDPDSRDLDRPTSRCTRARSPSRRVTLQRIPATVLTFNQFNRQMLDHIQQNGYYDKSKLQQMSDEFDSAGTRDRPPHHHPLREHRDDAEAGRGGSSPATSPRWSPTGPATRAMSRPTRERPLAGDLEAVRARRPDREGEGRHRADVQHREQGRDDDERRCVRRRTGRPHDPRGSPTSTPSVSTRTRSTRSAGARGPRTAPTSRASSRTSRQATWRSSRPCTSSTRETEQLDVADVLVGAQPPTAVASPPMRRLHPSSIPGAVRPLQHVHRRTS